MKSKEEAIKVHKNKVTPTWRQHFENYLKSMPLYYGMVNKSKY